MKQSTLQRVGLCALSIAVCAAAVLGASPGTDGGAPAGPRAVGTEIEFDLGDAPTATVTISGPDGKVTQHGFQAGETARVDLASFDGPVLDGSYVYEIVGAAHGDPPTGGYVHSGTFEVSSGEVRTPEGAAEPGAVQPQRLGSVNFDQRLVVKEPGSCFGQDCRFGPTGSPSRDVIYPASLALIDHRYPKLGFFKIVGDGGLGWYLGLDQASDDFVLEDRRSSAKVRVAYSSPPNSLVVAGDGKLGLGTGTPARSLHIKTRQVPIIRLEHNAGNPATTHNWDIQGTVSALRVGDGSLFPLQIASGAPTNAVFVAASGAVGVGLDAPTSRLHVQGTLGSPLVLFERPSTAQLAATVLELRNPGDTREVFNDTTGHAWSVGTSHAHGFVIDDTSTAGLEFSVDTTTHSLDLDLGLTTTGDAVLGRDLVVYRDGYVGRNLTVNGNLEVQGQFINLSSRAVKHDFLAVDTLRVLELVAAMPISTWVYDSQPETRHMGPMAEDFAAAFNLGSTTRGIATVDSAGVALAAIQGLHQKLETENAELRQRIDTLEALVRKLAPAER